MTLVPLLSRCNIYIRRGVASQISIARCRFLTLAIVASAANSSIVSAEGAFAVGRSAYSSWGAGVHDFSTNGEAQSEALRRCSRHGAGCRVVTTFTHSCFGIAVQRGTNGYGWTIGSTAAGVRAAVLNQCLAHGKPCEVKVAMCDGGQVGVAPTDARPPLPQSPKLASPIETSQSPDRGCERYPELCQ